MVPWVTRPTEQQDVTLDRSSFAFTLLSPISLKSAKGTVHGRTYVPMYVYEIISGLNSKTTQPQHQQ